MATKRTVLIVNIDQGSEAADFSAMYHRLLEKLKASPELSVSTVDSIKALQDKCARCVTKDKVLLFTNEFIAKRRDLHRMVKQFVHGGGLAIFGCMFSSYATAPDMDWLFKLFGLPWKSSSYYRTTFGLTEVGMSLLGHVSASYSAKALQLAEVLPEQTLYKPVADATTESTVFSSEPADPSLVMSALGKFGRGAVAYVGDTDAEEDSDLLTVALCLATW